MFPVEPQFYSICFAQSSPLLGFIAGPRGEALHLPMETFILGSHQCFRFMFVMGKSKWLIAPPKKRKELGKQPPSNELKHEYSTIVQYMPYCVCLALAI
jgi:hypothetical protein